MTVPKPARLRVDNLPTVFPNAAGLDIGSAEIVAALPPDRDVTVIRTFTTFTADLQELVTWLLDHHIDTVAMESTGVYWIPIYEMLEAAAIRVYLVNARHFKIVPGRKSDYNDAQWLQELHALGLLEGSFRPDDEMCVLRSLLRHRAQLIEHRSPHILHMQKALKLMNIQLPEVLSDVTGVTGMAILRAIVAGERRGDVLARLRRPGCRRTEQDIIQALTGTWRDEHLFVLAQSLDLYDHYTAKIAECDHRLDQQFSSMKPRFDVEGEPPAPPTSRTKKNSNSKNQPAYNVRAHLVRILGIDLVDIIGISESLAQTIISEIGTDMSRFPTSKHFCSWLGLAPHSDISGGKVLRSRVIKVRNRAGQALRQAAQSCSRSHSLFGAFYRARSARSSSEEAVVATAHKIARVMYHMLICHEAFKPESIRALIRSASKGKSNACRKEQEL
jgi:transposase